MVLKSLQLSINCIRWGSICMNMISDQSHSVFLESYFSHLRSEPEFATHQTPGGCVVHRWVRWMLRRPKFSWTNGRPPSTAPWMQGGCYWFAMKDSVKSSQLGGGNSNIFYFQPENWGRGTHFDSYFSDGLKLWNPPTNQIGENI